MTVDELFTRLSEIYPKFTRPLDSLPLCPADQLYIDGSDLMNYAPDYEGPVIENAFRVTWRISGYWLPLNIYEGDDVHTFSIARSELLLLYPFLPNERRVPIPFAIYWFCESDTSITSSQSDVSSDPDAEVQLFF